MSACHEIEILMEKENEESEIVKCRFDQATWILLSDFRTYARDLAETSLAKNPCQSSFNFSFSDKGHTIRGTTPQRDVLDVALLRLRPFVLQKERTSFLKVKNVLWRTVDNKRFHAILKMISDDFTDKGMLAQLKIASNDMTINSEKTLEKWLNAYHYHKDKQKAEELEAAHVIFPVEASNPIFCLMIEGKISAVLALARVIEIIQENVTDRAQFRLGVNEN